MARRPAPRDENGPDVAAFIARSEIAANLARHSRSVDRNDAALLPSASTADGTVVEGSACDFATMLTGATEGAPTMLHRTTNMLIRVEGDRARSESYVIAYGRTPGAAGPGPQRLIGGRYLDRHERSPDGWRIAHRTYVLDWTINLTSPEAVPDGWLDGAQCDDDASHGLFGAFHTHTGQALHDLVCTYARAVDRADEALLASVFHPDADVVTGVIDGKGPDFARGIVTMLRGNARSAFHSITDEHYDIAGETATGEVHILAHMVTLGDEPQETLTGGRYLDRYERRDGTWRIARRTFVHDWSMSQPATFEQDGLFENLKMRGGWAPDDPSYGFFGS